MIKVLLPLLLLASMSVAALQNNLADHASPYLAMHGDDPVHWQDWGEAALEQARKEDKLLYVSSGYFSCHWCHVMQQESYRNPEIAKILNTHYIPIKIDRELQPALDAHLIDFVQRTQGSAGWPLNVFLTPEGYPVLGMTYRPADQFKTLLQKLQDIWDADRDSTRDLARRALLQLVVSREKTEPVEEITPKVLHYRLEEKGLQYGDVMLGGFGQQNKFPMAPQLRALLALQKKQADVQLEEFLRLSLDQMAKLGLRDHLGGGFYRYTVDPGWQVPHYEKMLYTQAQLAELFIAAAEVLDRPEYLLVAIDTLNFVLKDMQGKNGAYIASFSAVDDKGVEGGYYLWSREELNKLLSDDERRVANRYWTLDTEPAPGEGYLPLLGAEVATLAAELKISEEKIQQLIKTSKQKLLVARGKRVLPADTKELAGWNGLLLGALAQAARLPEGERYRKAGAQLRKNLMTRLWDGKVLLRARDGDKPLGSASLQDYAFVAYGLTQWAELTGHVKDKVLAKQLLTRAWALYFNDDGWSDIDKALLPGMPRNKAQDDGALPSAAALVIRLSAASDDDKLVANASKAMKLSFATVTPDPFWYASHALALIEQSTRAQTGTVNQ